MSINKKIAFKTLGCRLNQYETDALASAFDKAGYGIVEFEDPADVYIINTCTVTNQSDRRSRQVMNQALRRDRDREKVSDTEHPGAGGELGAQSGTDPERSEGTKQEKEKVSDTDHSGDKGELNDPSGTDPERSKGTKQEKESPFEGGNRGMSMKEKEPLIIMTGCSVNNHKEALSQTAGVKYFVENEQKSQILNIVDAHFRGEMVDPSTLQEDLFGYAPAKRTFHTRSIIKIQDGCDNFCTFCIIPMVRGRAASRPVGEILENIRQVVEFGYKEVVLTGVNIGRYDYEGLNFDDLVERILDLPGDFRVRISSIEPDGFGDKLFRLFGHPKLTPHMHLCLQSGSERILLAMRRMYTARRFREITEKIRKITPDFNFTTDIIVGFPGETEEEFLETASFAKDIGFSHIHTFKYSRRSGTRADRMADQVPEEEKTRRSEIIREISEENKRRYRQSMLGREQRVIIEKIEDGMASGYGEHYIPIAFPAGDKAWNDWARVKMLRLQDGEDPLVEAEQL